MMILIINETEDQRLHQTPDPDLITPVEGAVTCSSNHHSLRKWETELFFVPHGLKETIDFAFDLVITCTVNLWEAFECMLMKNEQEPTWELLTRFGKNLMTKEINGTTYKEIIHQEATFK